ncbi:hypothetical protein HS088_TW11G00963 [Tripterygium wilfordii]|uniref:Uncharacterized protein n=1 Tax=Tripterygium wilfordii TaxID=458696 RepID=A0A7J7D3I5_TRIWF|nr:uncharacterized protein LOC120008530 [Tripterygium wilfordii]XP_038714814.1 uncharacterized protein LOC120008530 [Tripterygium wilfordii]KAF5740883.1 hypothetical protein HS088_TW11G00963 [Tripterygium wilfordii]
MRGTQNTSSSAFISKHAEDVINGDGGLLFCPPPSLSYSYPPSTSFNNQSFHNYQKLMNQQQPPLLPMPISSRPNNNFVSSRGRSFSCPPNTRKTNKATRDHSLTPKKSKQQPPPNKREQKQDSKSDDESGVMVSVSPLGPDTNDLPKSEKFSGSVFTLSPPPSSLPLPKFSLRSKLSCNAEAAGIDNRATDSLRRILRLL